MRTLLAALGALLCVAGSAHAQVYTVETYDTSAADMRTVHVDRYAFDAVGRSAERAATDACAGAPPSLVHQRRTAGDVAAAVFSLGWDTPEHVDLQCASAVTSQR